MDELNSKAGAFIDLGWIIRLIFQASNVDRLNNLPHAVKPTDAYLSSVMLGLLHRGPFKV
jgi:hypothetical protein